MGHALQSNLRRWEVISGLCKSIDAKTYIEIGCKEGRTVGFVLNECPDICAVAIDPWKADPSAVGESYAAWDFAKIEREFWQNVGAHKRRCQQFRCTSAEYASEAVNDAGRPREYFDVIFIDAQHDHASVLEDIDRWWPMVRPGGFLTGHDFNHKWPGVMRAVSESFNLMDVEVAPDSVWIVRKSSEVPL